MSLRQERIAEQLREVIGRMFQGGMLSDPRLQFVTISHVKVSPDLQVATVYYRVIGGGAPDEKLINSGLERATGLFKREIGRSLELRRIPQIRFFYDTTVDHASRIDELISRL